MRFKTLRIERQPDDGYAVIVDGTSRLVPDLRSLNEIIAEIDPAPTQSGKAYSDEGG